MIVCMLAYIVCDDYKKNRTATHHHRCIIIVVVDWWIRQLGGCSDGREADII